MNLRSVSSVALLASLLAGSAMAQTAPEAPPTTEEDINYTLPTDEWYVPKSTLSFGVRMLNKGINVKFGNLGTVTSPLTNGPDAKGNRVYSNGYVLADSKRDPYETVLAPDTNIANGKSMIYGELIDGGTRYRAHIYSKDENGNVTDRTVGEGLSYQAGWSREWQVSNAAQINGQVVRMNNYSAVSEGATVEKDEGLAPGIEMSLARVIGKVGRRVEWGVVAGVAINTMNAKTSADIRSTLITYSDYYRLQSPVAEGVVGGPTFTDFTSPDAPTPPSTDPVVYPNANETTVPISQNPDSTNPRTGQVTEVAGGAEIHGNWQVKGAYFLLRVGPSVRTQLTERFGLSASVGVAGAYAGSRYSVMEQLHAPDLTEPLVEERWDADSKLLAGFYADVNLDWSATDRTGFYAGVSMQQFGTYNMSVAGRTAKIDLGNAVGLRGGINIKF